MTNFNLKDVNDSNITQNELMEKFIFDELQKTQFSTVYDLSKKIYFNQSTGIKRYLDRLVERGRLRFVQRILKNRLVTYYYIPKFAENPISRFYFPQKIVDLLGWKPNQTIYLHMTTSKYFQFTNSIDTDFFTFATLEYKLQNENGSSFIYLPENFLYFYQINKINEENFCVNRLKTVLTYEVQDEAFNLDLNPPKKIAIEKENDLNDWRRNLIQYNAPEIMLNLPTHIICCTIPILDKLATGNFRIYGTAFLYSEKGGEFIITAYHNIFNWYTDQYLDFFIGFQTRTARKIVLIEKSKISQSEWLTDKKNDLAILSIQLVEKVKNDMIHEFITRDELPKNTYFRNRSQGIHVGFGHGKCSIVSTNPKSGKAFPIFMPRLSSYIVFNFLKDSSIHIHSLAIDGFSGAPLFFFKDDKYYLVGVMSDGRFLIDRKTSTKWTAEKGIATHFNEVITLLNSILFKSIKEGEKISTIRIIYEVWDKFKQNIQFVEGKDEEFKINSNLTADEDP